MKVWDLPTRLFHWLLVLLIGFSWWSAETGYMDWHYRSGISALILLVFRVLWGFLGSRTARFSSFLRSPAAVLAYLRSPRGSVHVPGHNPLGGYSVVGMLLTLGIQIGTGVFAVDIDGLESGPLSHMVSFDLGRTAAEVHHLTFTALQILVAMHLLAIVYYRIRGRRLVLPMVTGLDPQVQEGSQDVEGGSALRAILALMAALLLGWWVSAGAPL